MNERQYRQVLHNRRVGVSQRLGGARVAGILRQAAKGAHQFELVRNAWREIAEPGWVGHAEVAYVERGTAVVEVEEATLRHVLTTRAEALGRQLAGRVPGVSRVRFVFGSAPTG